MDSGIKTVLIVEDEPAAAELFAEMMRVNDFNVVKSSGSTQAITIIKETRPDLVLLDIMMPDISGLEVLKFMQRDPNLQRIPVIVVSAKSMPQDIASSLDAGAAMYLTKPVGYLDLMKAVEKVLPKDPAK
ncbi:MAG: response regulator [Anaerolineales bacterium]|nr:response regulator [Anaerolineales bacterium]